MTIYTQDYINNHCPSLGKHFINFNRKFGLQHSLSYQIIFVLFYRHRPSDGQVDALSTDSGAMGSKTSGDIRTIKFNTGNPPQSKRIWKCAVEQHTFFR